MEISLKYWMLRSIKNSTTVTTRMRDFQDTTRYCLLLDLCYHGPKFTWCNKREDGLICKKLDRVLINDKWLGQYQNSCSVFDSSGYSDIREGRIELVAVGVRHKKPFKFANVLVTIPKFHLAIVEHWENTNPLFMSTSALYRLGKKLKELKPTLHVLGREVLGDLPRRTKEAYDQLCVKQQVTLQNLDQDMIAEENISFEKLQKLVDLEQDYLQQKAKLHWLTVGDRNNAFIG